MNEKCPLSTGGFYYQEHIPEICLETCEALWEAAIKDHKPDDHEEYPACILSDPNCAHEDTEYGNSSLQATGAGLVTRLYGITERCVSCNDEIAEDSYTFKCPNA